MSMKLFEIGNGEYVNIEFIVYVHENNRQIEMINGDKISMKPMLFNELLDVLNKYKL